MADEPRPDWATESAPHNELVRSRVAAEVASRYAAHCWRGLVNALEGDRSIQTAHEAFDRALAGQIYAWAVHHTVAAEARSAGQAPLPAAAAYHDTALQDWR